jgi:hypothetical protein
MLNENFAFTQREDVTNRHVLMEIKRVTSPVIIFIPEFMLHVIRLPRIGISKDRKTITELKLKLKIRDVHSLHK